MTRSEPPAQPPVDRSAGEHDIPVQQTSQPTPPIGTPGPPPGRPVAGPVAPTGQVPPAGQVPPGGQASPTGQIEPAPSVAGETEPVTVRRSRFGGLWVGLVVAAVILVLLLVFVLQNSQTVQVDYFGFSGHLPLAVAILLGVAAGALLVALPGTVRILQLRKTIRRH